MNLGKTRIMVSGDITKDSMSKCDVNACGVCSLRVKADSVLYLQCGKCIHSRCTRVKRVTPKFTRSFTCRNVKGILERQWSRRKSYGMKWKLYGISHILVTGLVSMDDVRLL